MKIQPTKAPSSNIAVINPVPKAVSAKGWVKLFHDIDDGNDTHVIAHGETPNEGEQLHLRRMGSQ